jgi:hypothetical protein
MIVLGTVASGVFALPELGGAEKEFVVVKTI